MKININIIIATVQYILAPIITGFVAYYFGKKTENSKNNISDFSCGNYLYNHPFFARMNALQTTIQLNFTLPNRGKQEVFKDLLSHTFKIFIEQMQVMLKDIEKNNILLKDGNDLYSIVIEYYDNALKECNIYYKNGLYTEIEKECLEIVLFKFNKWNSQRVVNSQNNIMTICTSKFYTTNTIRIAVIFDMLLGQFVGVIDDAERTLNELNGDLKGKIFRGILL